MANIFITGATGFLGWDMAKDLLEDKGSRLYLLVRGKSGTAPQERVNKLIKKDYSGDEIKGIADRIEVIEGDITGPGLGIDKKLSKRLYEEIDTIYHSAALCEFGVKWERIETINVGGTKNVLEFAKKCASLKRFNHISTVALAGNFRGVFYESYLDKGQKFNNTYERSKFETEKLVHAYEKEGLNASIFRPGIITGDYVTGETDNFQMFYQFLHILSLELFDELPVNKDTKYGFSPVDYVAKAICLISSGAGSGKTYHITNPNTVSFPSFLDKAASYFGFKKPALIPKEKYDFDKLTGFRRKLIDFYMPYMIHEKIDFDLTNFSSAI
ncbi:MAG: SDR family oxidoreductase, partial [Candidatus Omnitrophota bacterium]